MPSIVLVGVARPAVRLPLGLWWRNDGRHGESSQRAMAGLIC
jgi:hypothetical protein